MFQSTPLCEGRQLHVHCDDFRHGVCFNPRPCVRGDWFANDTAALANMFQSTPLCEGRQLLCYQIDLLVVLGWLALTVVVGLGLMGICCLHGKLLIYFNEVTKR